MTTLLVLAVLATAPADTTRYVVLNHGRPAGEMLLIRGGDSLIVRYHHVDRNRGPRLVSTYRFSGRGDVRAGETRALDAAWRPGPLTDRYEVVDGTVRWGRPGDSARTARHEGDAFYRLRGGTVYDDVLLAQFLLRRSDRTARNVPAGTIRLEQVADTVVRTRTGRLRARLMLLRDRGATPRAVWLDDRGELVATAVGWFITVRPDADVALPALRAVELRHRERAAAALAARLPPRESGTLAIVGADLFDSEQGVIRPRQTVVISGGRIAAVGLADSVVVPPGATVIEAGGRTLVPGLYDMHQHLQVGSQTGSGLWQLAAGVTTIRDLAADADVAVSHRDRAATLAIVSPRVILGGFMEGPGRWAGPSEVIVRTEDEARAWVARYDSLGYRQIKLYNLVHPDLVPTIAAETRARGLRLSGHVPRGLSVQAAVELGFDEINHAAFLFSTFFQDSLYTPAMRAYSAVAAAVAPRFDVDGPAMTALIEFLRARRTVVDGTFSLWVQGGGGVVGQPLDTSSVAAAGRAYLRLARRLYDAGVTMVPGTDAGGPYALNAELETYERAGIPAPFVLQMATIVSARVMGEDREYGSIAPGKAADLVLVRGRPAERLADLRNVERVVRAGRLYDPGDLLEAVGLERRRTDAARQGTGN